MLLKIKRYFSYLTIIILLPYIITVFLSGPSISTFSSELSDVDDKKVHVRIESSGSSGNEEKEDAYVIEMSLEEYGIGILAKEIPATFEKEALKAQAIVVRTNIYEKLEAGGSEAVLEEAFWDKEQMEKAWGSAKYLLYYGKLKNAWEETKGQAVVYEGHLAKTPFCRLTNGSTRDAKEVLGSDAYPYLKIVDCPQDIENTSQMQTFVYDELDAEVTVCDAAGYVLTVSVGGESVSGEEFRANYHLPSSCFTLQNYEDKLRITTRGIGHGLGMSQNTANAFAKEGKTAEEILQYFFEGTEIREVAEIVNVGE